MNLGNLNGGLNILHRSDPAVLANNGELIRIISARRANRAIDIPLFFATKGISPGFLEIYFDTWSLVTIVKTCQES